MQHIKQRNKLIILALVAAVLFVFSGSGVAFATEITDALTEVTEPVVLVYTFAEPGSKGIVTTTALNLRAGPGTDNVALAYIKLHDEVTILDNIINEAGEHWYYVETEKGSKGYASAKFILIDIDVEYVYDAAFESYLTLQGFPESYKPYLRDLHARYPNWVFNAAQTGLDWNAVIDAESGPGTTLVASSSPSSWKSMEEGAYDYENGKYITYDSGGWVTASEQIIRYYMDPRNFINSIGIFQFLTHSFDIQTQNVEGLQKVVQNSFMKGEFPEETHATWADAIYQAGQTAGVNPYVLASMILVEQGSSGNGGCISGTVKGYEGYYNFFNIGAYKSGSMSAVERGVWYASQSGTYERPWNTRYKSILGGALFYSQQYVQKNKNTLYFKKFNVMNGQENVGIGQYMTNVQGAESEAAALRNGYIDTLSDAMTFYIPVYQNMPEEACQQPADGNNNTYLESLSVEGYELTPEFSRSKTEYELVVGKDVVFVNINAAVSSSTSAMTGGGMVILTSDITKAEIIVTAASGQTRTYTVTISKMAGVKPEDEEPAITSSEYIFDTYLKGVNELTELDEFAGNIQVTGGQAVIKNAKGEILSEGKITTGTSVVLQDKSGLPVIEYQVVIRGDVSGDGKINSADALGIQRHIVESRVMEGAYLEAADINQDGRVNSLDVLYVQKHIVGSYTIEN
ncbi:MAG: SH3 domain-containing protein [Firmicutes bacterium]|nr:SH3 domain-containing protein [Bacillota bacterium]